jgi:hypothetical protein
MRVGQAQSGPTSADEHHVADEHYREHDQPDLNPLGAEDLAMLTPLPSDGEGHSAGILSSRWDGGQCRNCLGAGLRTASLKCPSSALPAEVAVDRIPELVGEIERLGLEGTAR